MSEVTIEEAAAARDAAIGDELMLGGELHRKVWLTKAPKGGRCTNCPLFGGAERVTRDVCDRVTLDNQPTTPYPCVARPAHDRAPTPVSDYGIDCLSAFVRVNDIPGLTLKGYMP